MGNVINYEEYIKDPDSINDSPEASLFMTCDCIRYTVETINLSKKEPEYQKRCIDNLDKLLKNLKNLLNNNDIQANKLFCFNPDFSGENDRKKQG